jgi:hypothetical protein
MPSEGFEPATPATKRPQTYALDRAATEVGNIVLRISNYISSNFCKAAFAEKKYIELSIKIIKIF